MSTLVLCVSHFSTKLFGLDRTVGFFRTLGRMRGLGRSVLTAEQLAERALSGMQILPLRLECLDQAIAIWYMLNRYGHPATLRIGMRLTPVSGHAWVTCNGATFVSIPGMEDLTEVASYPPWSEEVTASLS
jgi:hypothetical protein